MQSSESIVKLAKALVSAQAELSAVGKSGENKFDKYTYAMLEDYVKVAKPILAKHGLAIVAGCASVTHLPTRTTKNGGTEHAVDVQMSFRIIHESGEWVEALMHGEGQDRADKAIYKAITGARKYAAAAILNLATRDDPEADEAVGTSAPASEPANNGNGSRPSRGPASDRADKAIAKFKELGIPRDELEAYLGKYANEWREVDLTKLSAYYKKCESQNAAAAGGQ